MTKRPPNKIADPAAEAAPAATSPSGKLGVVARLLRGPAGASIGEMSIATGWQPHSIRGVLAGTLKKKHGLTITSEKTDGERRYRIVEATA